MKTPKSVYYKWKFSPVNLMDRGRFQDWLNQMARQGLFYHWYSNKVIRFIPGGFPMVRFQVKAPDPNRRYHLYPAPELLTEPPADLLERYRQYGWTYVDYIPSSCISYFLFATDDPSAAEPNSDPESLYRALRFPVRNLLILAFPTLILMLVCGIIFSGSWGGLESSQQLSPVLQVFGLLLLALLLSLLLSNGFQWLAYFLLRREIREEHTARPSLPRWMLAAQRVLAVIETAALLAALLLPSGTFLRRLDRLTDARHEVQTVVPQEQVTENIPLEDWEPDFDLLTLSEMEGDGSWTPTEDFTFAPGVPSMEKEIHYNVVDLHEAPEQPIPTWYTISQDGTGNSGTSSLSITYYLARDGEAAQARLERERTSSEHYDYQPIEVPGAEEFWYDAVGLDPAENVAPAWFVLARKGDRLLELRYDGSLDLSRWFDDIAAMLTPVE